MKKLLKINDSNLQNLQAEKEELLNKIENLEKNMKIKESSTIDNKILSDQKSNKLLDELKSRIISLENENTQIKSISNDFKAKYESLREVDSPIKEVSNMKKILKENDKKLENLQKENLELVNKNKPLESKIIEYEHEIVQLNDKIKQLSDHYEAIKEIDSPTKDSKRLKQLIIDNEKSLNKLKEENENLMKQINTNKEKLENFKKLDNEKKLLEIRNNELFNEISDIKEKYESLREIDSPLKGVNEMKQILKKSDEKLLSLRNENLELQSKYINYDDILQENNALVQENQIRTEKYETLLKQYNILNEELISIRTEITEKNLWQQNYNVIKQKYEGK